MTTGDSLPNDFQPCVAAFVMEEEDGLQGLTTPSPRSSSSPLQLVESDEKLSLFSEKESDRDLLPFRVESKKWKTLIEGDVFRQARGGVSEGEFTAIIYYIRNGVWRCSGHDLHFKSWKSLPPLAYLPSPDAELFKEYSVCGHGGLMCAEVSKLPSKGEFVVFNPLTRMSQALPPLLYPRNPVLVHLSVDSDKKSYKVIVAGSSAASDEDLSRKMEVFHSSTSRWKEVCDLRGPVFGLNEHQDGVCLNGKLFFISFLENGCRRGVVAFDLQEEKWVQSLTTPIPWSSYSNNLQLVESDGKLFLFSEKEIDQSVNHCIDELQFPDPEAGVSTCQWINRVQFVKSGGRGLQVYPEHCCVRFGEGKLCIFNTLYRDGVVYDVRDGTKCEDLEPPPAGDNFFSLNPASFKSVPNFDSDPSFPISSSSESERYSNYGGRFGSEGKLFLFSEKESDQSVDHCIHELEFPDPEAGILGCRWRIAEQFAKSGGRGLQLMPSGASAGDPSIGSVSCNSNPSISPESLDIAKAVAGTVFAGLMMIGAGRVAWGIFRRIFGQRQTPGVQFDIDGGLNMDDPLPIIFPAIATEQSD